jgi:NADH dehydrogenase [ubiquinone] 1 alpha subcomplex assembly factor 1
MWRKFARLTQARMRKARHALSMSFVESASAYTSNEMLASFERQESVDEWKVNCDSDMGGLSTAEWRYDDKERCGVLSGNLSLHVPIDLQQKRVLRSGYAAAVSPVSFYGDLESHAAIRLIVKTDGRPFVCNLTPALVGDEKILQVQIVSPPNRWASVVIPLDAFVVTWRGYVEGIADSSYFNGIERLGILMAERKDGPFRISIRSIEAIAPGDEDDPNLEAKKRYDLL